MKKKAPTKTPGKFSGYTADTLKFLKQLKANNQRDWFQEHKSRYEDSVVTPSLQFIGVMAAELERFAPLFQAVAKRSGGSMMRIYRDTRFSKDKTPYKTNVGIHFRHQAGKDVHAPGFYVHLEPKSIFLGAGIWHPEPSVAAKIRQAIVDDPAAWKRAAHRKAFADQFQLKGDSLKRPPRGFDKNHRLIEDIQRKDFIGVCELPDSSIRAATFAKDVSREFRKAVPLVRLLCNALELPF